MDKATVTNLRPDEGESDTRSESGGEVDDLIWRD